MKALEKTIKDDKWKIIIINVLLFLFLIIFFIRICPIIPYDIDDWLYIGQMRMPFPIWNGWNPSKVLPEVLMPMCGYISAYIVYPFIGDYFYSITITAAVMVSFFIVALCFSLMQFIRFRLHLSVKLSLVIEVLFLIFTFLIFRNRGTSRYLFSAENMNCIFNYTIPGIVNAIAVLVMMRYEDFQKSYQTFGSLKKGLFISLIYFAIFSNIFHSETVAIYCGVILLSGLAERVKKKGLNLTEYIKAHAVYVAILCTWIVSIIFEMNGARAAHISSGAVFSFEVSLRQLFTLITALADYFVVAAILAGLWILFRIIYGFHKKGKEDAVPEIYLQLMFNLALLTIYLVILSAGVNYMSRIEASWNIWFYLILIVITGVADFVKTYSRTKPFLIPALITSMIVAFYPDGRFLISTAGNVDYVTCVNTGRYMVDQIIDADRTGQESMVLHAPMYTDGVREWVFGGELGEIISTTLYNHGMIRRKMDVDTYNDPDLIEVLCVDKEGEK